MKLKGLAKFVAGFVLFGIGMVFLVWSYNHVRDVWIANSHSPKTFFTQVALLCPPLVVFLGVIYMIVATDKRQRKHIWPAIIVIVYLSALILNAFAEGIKMVDSEQAIVFDGMCSDIKATDNQQKDGVFYSAICGGKAVRVFPNAAILNDSFGNPVASFHCKIRKLTPDRAECGR